MNEFVERLGWMLVHSLWQFALVALLAGVIARAMRRSSSAARYGALVVAMAVMIVVPVATWLSSSSESRDDLASRRASAPGHETISTSSPGADAARLAGVTKFEDPTSDDAQTNDDKLSGTALAAGGVGSSTPAASAVPLKATGGLTPSARHDEVIWLSRIKAALQPWLTWIVAVWCIGVAICSLRPLLGWHTLWRLKRVGVSPASEEVLAVLRRVAERLQLRRAVSVLHSTLAQVPVVVGYLRPVVLLPVSLMTSLPAEQLEAILAHELAHVRRHDFVVNLLQTLIESFFFYHPAVWWLSHQIRVEREHCCDDLVVTLLGNRVEYGRALLAIEEQRGTSPVLALGATDGSLLSRVRRIVGIAPEQAAIRLSDRWPVAFVTLACLLTLALGTFVSSRAEMDPPLADRAGRGSPDPALAPTAGLPDSGTDTKTTKNANGDLRSNPAAGSGDPRRALATIKGEVIDSVTGKPIAGATVRFRFGKLQDGLGSKERLAELVFRNVGRFTFELPEAVKGQTNDLFVERIAEHPDYQTSGPSAVPLHLLFNKEPNHAHAFIRKVELVPGEIVSGQVLDIDGRPAKGIAIFSGRNQQGWQNDSAHTTTTDANGRYRLVVRDRDRGRVYVIPNHAAAVSRAITPEFGEQPVFRLQRGTRLFGRVTDAKGRGVAGVAIRADGSNRVPIRTAMTDADGRYSLPPCQYGQYVVQLFDEGRFPELPKDGVRLPDVYLHQLVDLPKTALAEQQLDFKPTESVRMTARYTTSNDQPVSGRTLSVNGAAGKASWWGRLREVTDQPGLYELRVPRGFEGRIDQNADLGGFLRIVREGPNSSPTSAWSTTKFEKDGVSFHVRSLKATSITLRATHDGQPVKIAGALSTPQFADQKAADEAGARLPSNQFRHEGVGQLWFDVHPDIDLLLKLNVPGFKPWQSTVKVAEGEDRVIDVPLEADKANDAQAKVESKPAESQKGNESLADQAARSEEVFARKVSLDVKELPLREALAKLAQAARVPLKLDEPALKKAELDLDEPVTVAFQDEPLSSALGLLIDWNFHPDVFRELRGGAMSLSTIEAKQERMEQALPDWLKPPNNHGLLANIDDDNQVFSITAGDALTDELLTRFKTLPKLRELDIGYTKTITAAGLAHLAQLTALEKLTLSSLSADGVRLGDEALKHIVGLKSLRELHLNECGTTDAGIRLLEQMPQLTHLDVYQEGRLTDAAIDSIAKLKRLKHLGLNAYVGSQELGWMRFSMEATKSLAGLQELEHLHLVGQGVSSETLQFPRLKSLSLGIEADDACAARIAECRQLQSLQLVFTSITDDGLKAISGLTELKRLNIDSHLITDTGIGHLKTLPKLDHLSLRASKLTDESLAHIAEIKSLTRLDINGSGHPGFLVPGNLPHASFTVPGLLKLKVLPNLLTLWLTNFSSSGGYSALKELKQLTELTFMMADLSSTDFSILEEALLNTRITSATGGGGFSTEPKRKKRAAR